MSSALTINGVPYTLVGNIKTLAADIVAKPGGAYALAGTYDASADGTYTASPIGTPFTGTFEGLANTILNLHVGGATIVGLFMEIGDGGTARDVGLLNANFVVSSYRNMGLGGVLARENLGTVRNCYATGTINAGLRAAPVGGLVGENYGTVANSFATVTVKEERSVAGGLVALNSGAIRGSHAAGAVSGASAGGLVGQMDGGTIEESYATGAVNVLAPYGGGGLVGVSAPGAEVLNSYATGAVTSATETDLGGLVASNSGLISFSYSTGAVTGGMAGDVGGLIGVDSSKSGSLVDTDWDTDTSGITNLSQGAGHPANDPGITGLTTTQLQSGLPPGFDPKVWAENPNINGDLPYLLANPPAK